MLHFSDNNYYNLHHCFYLMQYLWVHQSIYYLPKSYQNLDKSRDHSRLTKIQKQAGVVHNITPHKIVIFLPYHKEIHHRDITIIVLLYGV